MPYTYTTPKWEYNPQTRRREKIGMEERTLEAASMFDVNKAIMQAAEFAVTHEGMWLSIIIKRTETQLSRLCVFSLLQPHRTEVRLTGKYRYLTFEDRKKIEAWHLLGDRPVDIAARLSVHHTTIYKELQRGATGTLDANQREGYSAELAERRLRESFKRRGKRAPAAQ